MAKSTKSKKTKKVTKKPKQDEKSNKSAAAKSSAKSLKENSIAAKVISPAKTGNQKTKADAVAKMRNVNLILAFIFAAQAAAIIILSNAKSLPVFSNFLAVDSLASKAAGHTVWAAATRRAFDANIVYIIGAMLIFTAVHHLLLATVLRKRYNDGLEKGSDKTKWVEYLVSGSIALFIIALISGVFELSALLLIVSLSFIMSVLGWTMESQRQNSREINWSNYRIGVFAGFVPWLIIAMTLVNTNIYSTGTLPFYIYALDGALLVLGLATAANMYKLYQRNGRWTANLYGEKMHIALNFLSRTALAWIIFFGLLK